MAERPSQTYACQSKGCANGFGSAFQAAPEDWFSERGFTPPKNCPKCRDWVKAQFDEAVHCSSCRRSRLIPAKYKISHHKRTGPWETPEKCKRCEEGKPPKQAAKPRPPREIQREEKRKLNFSDLPPGIPLEARIVVTDLSVYETTMVREKLHGGTEPRHTHLAHHMTGSPFSQVGIIVDSRKKSPTGLVDDDCGDVNVLLEAVAWECSQTDSQTSREYKQGRRIARLTDMGDGHVEETILEPHPKGGYVVVTTYDTVTVFTAKSKYEE